jgi:hypothetical protein
LKEGEKKKDLWGLVHEELEHQTEVETILKALVSDRRQGVVPVLEAEGRGWEARREKIS